MAVFNCQLIWKFDMLEKDFSFDFSPLLMFLYIAQVLPIIFPLKLIYSQIAFLY